MIKNIEVIEAFLEKQEAHAGNLFSTGDKLLSYNTCIGQWDGGTLIINKTKYSVTTSTHTNKLLYLASNEKYVRKVYNIPKNTSGLIETLNNYKLND